MEKIPCKWVKTNISGYLDAELTSECNSLIDRHLNECQPCRQFLSDLKSTKVFLNSLKANEDISAQEPAESILEGVASRLPKHEFGIFTDPVMRRIAVSIALVLVVFVGWFRSSRTPQGNLLLDTIIAKRVLIRDSLATEIRGKVEKYEDNQWKSLSSYARLPKNSLLRTKKDSHLKIQLIDQTSLLLKEESLLGVRDSFPEVEFSLNGGSVLVYAVKDSSRRKFSIYTPAAEIKVYGTLFKVFVDERITEVRVLKGEIIIKSLDNKEVLAILKRFDKVAIKNDSKSSSFEQLVPDEVEFLEEEFIQAGLYKKEESDDKRRSIILWREVK